MPVLPDHVAQLSDNLTALVQSNLFHSEMSVRQFALLLRCYNAQTPPGVGDMAQQLALSKPAVCRAMQSFNGTHLLSMVRSKADGRLVEAHPTPKGRALIKAIEKTLRDAESKGERRAA